MPCVKPIPERARRFAQATGTLAKTDRIEGVGTLTANQITATMPELGSLENKQAASPASPGLPICIACGARIPLPAP